MKKRDAFVIFSVFQSKLSHQDNLDNHKKTLNHLKAFGLKFKVVEGVYRGESELSIMVPVINEVFGKFISTTKGIATQCENYTKDGENYYICDLRGVA